MMTQRRIALQLTPLLDLLLIVIFAQYLETTGMARKAVHETERAKQQSDAAQRDAEQTQQWARHLKDAHESELNQIRERQQDVFGALRELFLVPESDLKTFESQLMPGDRELSTKEVDQLRVRLKEIAGARGPEVIHHLLTFNELQKRCDLWEIYVREDGQVIAAFDRFRTEFRADSPDVFAQKLFDIAQSWPQPKAQVLMLLSYGDAKFGARQAAVGGMAKAAMLLRDYRGDGTRFEYAVVGFRAVEPAVPPRSNP